MAARGTPPLPPAQVLSSAPCMTCQCGDMHHQTKDRRLHRSHFDCRDRCRTSTDVIDKHIHLEQLALPLAFLAARSDKELLASTYRSSLLSPPDTVTQLLFDGSFAQRNKVRARDMVCSAISTEVSSRGIRRLLRDLWYARGRHLRNRDVHNLLRNPFEMSFLWSLLRSCHG